ncbi:YjfB family protein [Paenibacillus sp. TRM 82003]|nr:YjfB family protein [Paenibacillus sp. TRM 82003]
MDIAALSMNMAQANLGQAVGISVLKMTQDSAVQQTQAMIKTMQHNAQPHLGGRVDLKA